MCTLVLALTYALTLTLAVVFTLTFTFTLTWPQLHLHTQERPTLSHTRSSVSKCTPALTCTSICTSTSTQSGAQSHPVNPPRRTANPYTCTSQICSVLTCTQTHKLALYKQLCSYSYSRVVLLRTYTSSRPGLAGLLRDRAQPQKTGSAHPAHRAHLRDDRQLPLHLLLRHARRIAADVFARLHPQQGARRALPTHIPHPARLPTPRPIPCTPRDYRNPIQLPVQPTGRRCQDTPRSL